MSKAVTVWERGRLDARIGPRQVLFGRMYEDAAIELDAFRGKSRIMCIASAGCTAMKLAPKHEVVAVDINPVQLTYAERRLNGDPCFRGRVERVMSFARFFAPLVGWRASRVEEFLELEDPAQQIEYWQQQLDTRRFRAALNVLFSVTALRAVYAPRFLDFLPKRLGAVMRARMEQCFSKHPNRSNPYAHALLLGELSSEPTPPEAANVRLVHADAASFLENEPSGSFDGFTLSNIVDGTDQAYQRRLLTAVKRAGAPGAVSVLRSFSEADAASPANRAADDRAMIWGSVLVQPVQDLKTDAYPSTRA